MKKKKIVSVFIIIIVVSLLGIIICNDLMNSARVIDLKINWNIKLPKNSIKEIYSANSGSSFHGDGIRYRIFSYKEENEDKIKEIFNWSIEEQKTIFYSSYRESINNWLNKIEVPKENYPNYSNCKYWYNKKDDNSEIITFWNSQENRLYIVESFL